MVRVLELLTVNIAVESLDHSVEAYERLGLAHVAPVHMPERPSQITDVSFPFDIGGGLSLIEATDDSSPVKRFLDRKGPGVYSLAIRVDDIHDAMRSWRSKGIEWALPQAPHAIEGAEVVGQRVERALVNWTRPRSFGGVMLEVFEFQGKVERVV